MVGGELSSAWRQPHGFGERYQPARGCCSTSRTRWQNLLLQLQPRPLGPRVSPAIPTESGRHGGKRSELCWVVPREQAGQAGPRTASQTCLQQQQQQRSGFAQIQLPGQRSRALLWVSSSCATPVPARRPWLLRNGAALGSSREQKGQWLIQLEALQRDCSPGCSRTDLRAADSSVAVPLCSQAKPAGTAGAGVS